MVTLLVDPMHVLVFLLHTSQIIIYVCKTLVNETTDGNLEVIFKKKREKKNMNKQTFPCESTLFLCLASGRSSKTGFVLVFEHAHI